MNGTRQFPRAVLRHDEPLTFTVFRVLVCLRMHYKKSVSMNLSVCVHRRTQENIRPADGRHTGGSAHPNLHRLWLFLHLCVLVGMTGECRRAESGVKDGDDNMIPLRMHGVTRISGETTCKWAPWWSPADMESSVVVQTSRIITEGQKSRRIACLLPTIRSASLPKIY